MVTVLTYVKSNWLQPLQQTNDVDCGQLVTPNINDLENLLSLNLTGEQYIKLLSSIHAGSELLYPDELHELTDLFTQALACPQVLGNENGNCVNYPPYSPFIDYLPANPFNGEPIPSGYVNHPFTVYDGGSSLPPEYLAGDIYTDITRLPIFGNWFNLFGGGLPSIKLTVVGSGQIEIDFISLPNGGRVLVGINKAPNIIDIGSGIFDVSSETLISTDRDITSFPPDDSPTVLHEIDIDEPVGTTTEIYLTFIPVVDIDVAPIKFGGGLRAIQLCGFETGAMNMGIEEVRIMNGQLQERVLGVWSDKGAVLETTQDIENYLPTSSTIINMNTAITAAQQAADDAQADADTNAAVLALTNADVAANNAAIAVAQQAADDAQADADTNAAVLALTNADVAANNAAIAVNAAAIAANDTELADHETRITTLEAASGGGSGLTTTIIVRELIAKNAVIGDTNAIPVPITSGYAWIEAHAQLQTDGTGNPLLQFGFNDDFNNANYLYRLEGLTGSNRYIAYVPNFGAIDEPLYGNVVIKIQSPDSTAIRKSATATYQSQHGDNGLHLIGQGGVYWESNAAINKLNFNLASGNFKVGSVINVYGFRTQEVSIPAPTPTIETVTFDAGGAVHSWGGDISLAPAISTGGNPNNALTGIGNAAQNDAIWVERDYGQDVDMNRIDFDMYRDIPVAGNVRAFIEVDGLRLVTGSSNGLWLDAAWFKQSDYSTEIGDFSSPVTGQVFRVGIERSSSGGAGQYDIRLDNIEFELA